MEVTIDDLSLFVISIIRTGAALRFLYCMVRLSGAEEEAGQYRKRSKNTVVLWIIAECIWQLKDIVLYYYT